MTINEIKRLSTIDGWVDFSGQIVKVGELKQRVKSERSKTPGEKYNSIKLSVQDETDTISVWAYADKQFLPEQRVTTRGMLKEYNNTRYIDYAEVEFGQAAAQTPPQQAQQPPQQAAQPSNAPEQGGNAVNIRKSVVCAYLMGGEEPELRRVVYWMDFIATGNAPAPPAKGPESESAPVDNIPF